MPVSAAGLAPTVPLLIPVTRFFRDPEAFEYLSNEVIPRLVAAHASNEPLRVWVAACSTGEEAYSIAILLAAMDRETVPPTLGYEQPFARNPLPLIREWQRRRIGIAAKLTCGFAGFYGAAVFRRFERGSSA